MKKFKDCFCACKDQQIEGIDFWHEAMEDPVCVKSRTEYVITVVNCPIMWQYKLQSETVLSIMEVETIALAQICLELFHIMDGVSIMGKAIGLPFGNTTI